MYIHRSGTKSTHRLYVRQSKPKGNNRTIRKRDTGLAKEEIGLHSIRSGGAIAMLLSGLTTIITQRVGRWKSDTVMKYNQITSGIISVIKDDQK